MKAGDIALMALAAVGVYFIIRQTQQNQEPEVLPVYINGFPWGGNGGPDVITVNVPPAPPPAPPPPAP